MNNSNSTIRNRVILKALVFTVIPLLFFGWGGYLIGSMQGEIDKDNIDKFKAMETEFEAFKIEEELFLTAMNTLNRDWKNYFNEHQKFITNNDSSSVATIENNIDKESDNILNHIETSKGKGKESKYFKTLVAFQSNFDNYLKAMENYRLVHENLTKADTGGGCCANVVTIEQEKNEWREKFNQCRVDLSSKGGSLDINQQRLDLCESYKEQLNSDIINLRQDINECRRKITEKNKKLASLTTELGTKHRNQLKTALSSSGINSNKKTRLLQSIPFGKVKD